jgi:tetratricopeptide (TPR) repeat protein
MKNLIIIFVFIAICVPGLIQAQTAHEFRRGGDKSYTRGEYNEAEEKYRKSLEDDPEMKAFFNLGNSLYNQQRFEEAREQYDKAIARTEDPLLQAKAYFNKGNSFFQEQKLKESIESYKEALRNYPDDMDAKRNLFLSKQLLKQQQQQQQQQQQEQQEQDQNKDQDAENEKQDKKDSQNESEDENKENQQNEEEKEDLQQNESFRDSSTLDSLMQKQITREELLKLLKAIEDEDKKIQQKLRRGTGKKTKSKKDW